MLVLSQSRIVAEGHLRVVAADLVDAVTADEDEVADAGLAQGLQQPVENPPAADGGVRLRLFVGEGLEPAAPARAQNECPHAGKGTPSPGLILTGPRSATEMVRAS